MNTPPRREFWIYKPQIRKNPLNIIEVELHSKEEIKSVQCDDEFMHVQEVIPNEPQLIADKVFEAVLGKLRSDKAKISQGAGIFAIQLANFLESQKESMIKEAMK